MSASHSRITLLALTKARLLCLGVTGGGGKRQAGTCGVQSGGGGWGGTVTRFT